MATYPNAPFAFASKDGRKGAVTGSAKDAKRILDADRSRRDKAGKDGKILNPNEVGGEWDGARVLNTTLGGAKRELTADDLVLFRRNIEALKQRNQGKKIQGGIRPAQVIQLSRDIDIERSNKQIRQAILMGGSSGKLRFQTNASGETPNVKYHYVNVELLDFQEFTAMPRTPKTKPLVAAKQLANSRIRFECDCGRHTFWYRYLATTGGWNMGREETGYPKERNPQLTGVACKHVLRVMRELTAGMYVHGQLAKMMDSTAKQKRIRVTQKQADQQAKNQRYAPKVVSKTKAAKQAERILKNLVKEDVSTRPGVQTRDAAIKNIERQVATGALSRDDLVAILNKMDGK